MKQKLILLALVIGLTVVSQSTLSLGMGNIQVYSSLDEPLSATIELMTNPDEDLENLTVKLASSDDYKKVGLDKSFVPSNIMVALDEDNPYLIKVTSNGPVSEPIVSLLLDVDWTNGRILREFTVLLDPPVYDVSSADVQVNNVVVEPIEEQVVEEPVLNEREVATEEPKTLYTNEDVAQYDETSTATETAEPTFSSEPQNSQVYVSEGDTLWRIANDNKFGGLSANQMMMAIYNTNPSAFIDNNINKLIKGSQLTMPSLSQAEAISYNDALEQVQSHNDSWMPAETNYSAYQTTETATDDYTDTSSSLDYGVQLSGGDSDGSDNGQSNAEVGDNETAQLSAEEKFNQEAENQDLQERISELEDIVEQQQSVLEVEDSSLANLEQQLDEAGETAEETTEQLAEDTQTVVDDVWDSAVDDVDETLGDLSVDVAVVDTTGENGMADEMVDSVDESTADMMVDETDEATTDADVVDDVAEPAKEEKVIPKFSGNTKQEESFVDKSVNWVMDNLQWVLIGLGGLVLLLLIPKFLRRDSGDEDETSFLDDIKQRKSEDAVDDVNEALDEGDDTKMNQPLDLDEDTDSSVSDESDDSDDVLAELDKSIVFDDDSDDTDETDIFANTADETGDDDGFDLDGFLNDENEGGDDSVTADHSETLAGVDFDNEEGVEFEDMSFDDLGDDVDESVMDAIDETKSEVEDQVDELANDISEASDDVADSLGLDDDLDGFDLDDLDIDADDEAPSTDDSTADKSDDEDEMNFEEDFDFDLDDDLAELDSDVSDDSSDDATKSDDIDTDDEFDDMLDLSDDEETFDTTESDETMDEEIDLGLEGLVDDGDAIDTKLDLAKAYLDMGDVDGAKNLLDEVVSEGNDGQIEEAKKILDDM